MTTQNSINAILTALADGWEMSMGTILRKLKITGADITLTGSGSNTHTFPASSSTLLSDQAAEISALTEKTILVDNDLFIIEDSEASNAKKKVKKSNVGGGGGLDASKVSKLRESDDGADALVADTSGNLTQGDGTGTKTFTIDVAAGQTASFIIKNAGTQIGSIVVDKTSATPDREKMYFTLGANGYGGFALQRNPGDEQLADDQVTTFAAPGMNRFLATIATNGEEYCEIWCPYNGTITLIHNSGAFNAVAGAGTLAGTTGTDGKINLRMSTGTLYIENRIGSARHYSLAIIGAST